VRDQLGRRPEARRTALPIAVVLALAAGGAAGCGRRPVHVVSMRASAGVHEQALRTVGLDGGALTGAMADALGQAGFRLDEARRGYRARLEVVSARRRNGGDGTTTAEIAVDLELRPVNGEGSPVLETGVGAVRIAPGAAPEAWRKALAAALGEAASGLAIALSEESKPAQTLIRDLGSKDSRLREQAMRVLGDRRSVEAVPALIERLDDPEPLLADRAAGALAQIRDPRAVAPLIDYSRRNDDAERTARFARIVGDIGGSEARGYLQTLESGHTDPRVRSAAREALQDLCDHEREQGRLSEKGAPRRSGPVDSGRMER
jgi:hypothetical protein